MSASKAILGVLLVFLLGFMTGGMAGAKFLEKRVRRAIDGGPDALSALIGRRLSRELDLRPAQRKSVDRVLDSARDRITAVRTGSQPEMDRIVSDTQTTIRALLDGAQAERFDLLVARSRNFVQKTRER